MEDGESQHENEFSGRRGPSRSERRDRDAESLGGADEQLRTQAAASDADTDPAVAAERLADWLNAVDREADCFLYDLMGGGIIPW